MYGSLPYLLKLHERHPYRQEGLALAEASLEVGYIPRTFCDKFLASYSFSELFELPTKSASIWNLLNAASLYRALYVPIAAVFPVIDLRA